MNGAGADDIPSDIDRDALPTHITDYVALDGEPTYKIERELKKMPDGSYQYVESNVESLKSDSVDRSKSVDSQIGDNYIEKSVKYEPKAVGEILTVAKSVSDIAIAVGQFGKFAWDLYNSVMPVSKEESSTVAYALKKGTTFNDYNGSKSKEDTAIAGVCRDSLLVGTSRTKKGAYKDEYYRLRVGKNDLYYDYNTPPEIYATKYKHLNKEYNDWAREKYEWCKNQAIYGGVFRLNRYTLIEIVAEADYNLKLVGGEPGYYLNNVLIKGDRTYPGSANVVTINTGIKAVGNISEDPNEPNMLLVLKVNALHRNDNAFNANTQLDTFTLEVTGKDGIISFKRTGIDQ